MLLPYNKQQSNSGHLFMALNLFQLFRGNAKTADAHDTQWVDQLPSDNPKAALEVILKKIQAIVPQEFPLENWRLESLLFIDNRCHRILLQLELQYVSIEKLRPELEVQIWESVYAYHRHFARAYQNFITHYVSHADEASFDFKYLPLLLARTVQHNANIAKWRYLRFQDMPEGGWLNLHKLISIAERENLEGRRFKLYDDEAESTCGEIYLQALMLGMLNHSAMSKLQINAVSCWLSSWRKLLSLHHEPDDHRYIYVVDTALDQGAKRLRKQFNITQTCRFWETDALIAAISKAASDLALGETPAMLGLGGSLKADAANQLLQKLIEEWSRTAYKRQRRSEDRQQVVADVFVSHGIEAVWQQVKEVSDAQKKLSGQYVALAGKSLDERLASHSLHTPKETLINLRPGLLGDHWTVRDESPRGFGILLDTHVSQWVGLGRLVALVLDGNQRAVSVGYICNLRQTSDGRRHVGIEVMAHSASSVVITNISRRDREMATELNSVDANLVRPYLSMVHGVFLPEDIEKGIGASVVMPASDYLPNTNYEIVQGNDHYLGQFDAIIQRADDWVRVRVKLQEKH